MKHKRRLRGRRRRIAKPDFSVVRALERLLLNACQSRPPLNLDALFALIACDQTMKEAPEDQNIDVIPLLTGSAAEFYIEPLLSCVGDYDIMYYHSDQLAIPAKTDPPTQLPDEFDSSVKVYDIVDSEFPGYVYLRKSYLLTECIDDDKYSAIECEHRNLEYDDLNDTFHGPATRTKFSSGVLNADCFCLRLPGTDITVDRVYCMRCLSWPTQADDWPTRHRDCGWPDSATIDHVVSNGCDLVRVAHHQYRGYQWHTQHRLSFSRAEIVLLNSWIPEQQFVYHVLRAFAKTTRLTDRANKLSNYLIKTLMLWTCERKPRSWWTDDLNLIRLCVELLHTLGDLLNDVRCPHYFIHNCNLLTYPDVWCFSVTDLPTAHRLKSLPEESLAKWFSDNYVRKYVQLFDDNVSQVFADVSNSGIHRDVLDRQLFLSRARRLLLISSYPVFVARSQVTLTVRSYLYLMREHIKIHPGLSVCFIAVTYLSVAIKTARDALTDELLDVLATTCLKSNDVRRCLNARHSSVLSLSQATKLMKVVANNSRSTVQLIEIELSKAYLYRALRCKDSDSDSIYCLANVYLAVLYYITGRYQTAIARCTLVTRSQGHSQCSSHVVQGELLPKIDDEIDNVLGLAVFYQYVRAAALNQQQQTQHVSVFTTELFAHYLHIRCLSITKCRQLTQTDEVQRYHKCFDKIQNLTITDVMLLNFVNRTNRTICPTSDQSQMVGSGQTLPEISHQLDTSKLVELLQQSAVEHLTTYRQLEAQERSRDTVVTTDFEAIYAYKCGEYQRCLQLSTHNVRRLIDDDTASAVSLSPEFLQLMDDDIASLLGLTFILTDISCSSDIPYLYGGVSQLYLSLYLMAQCQMKLHHSVTSLALTLHYVKVARRQCITQGLDSIHKHGEVVRQRVRGAIQFDLLLLQLIERKIQLYISRELIRTVKILTDLQVVMSKLLFICEVPE